MAEAQTQTRSLVWCLVAVLLAGPLVGCGLLNGDDDDDGDRGAPPAVQVTLNLTAVTVASGGDETFVATVTGSSDTSVTWEVDPGTCGAEAGSIASGVYTAGHPVEDCEVVIRAVCAADPSASADATVTVDAPTVVTLDVDNATVAPSGTRTFVATVTGAGSGSASVTWAVDPGTCGVEGGSVSASGAYTAGDPADDCQVTVRATSAEDPSKTASATVDVDVPVAVYLDLTSANVAPGGSETFVATVEGAGSGSTAVTWTVEAGTCGGDAGSVNASGTYTAGNPVDDCQVTVRATSVADASKSDAATVTIDAPVSVSLNLATATVAAGGSQTFVATVAGAGSGSTAVTWTVDPGTCGGAAGSVNASGVYTAGSPVDDCQVAVRATSVADASKSDAATVNVDAPISVSLNLATATVAAGGSQTFVATVAGAGSGSTAVTWTVDAGTCGGDAGSVAASGVYTAGSPVDDCQVAVRATSVADASKSAAATVTVDAPVAVSVEPPNVTLVAGATQPFAATVTGASDTSVTWSLDGAGCGSIDGSGQFSAGSPAASCENTVRATSVADGSASGTASVTVTTCANAIYTVTSVVDAVDANIGDNLCDDGSGNCTLRAAIQEANACSGSNTVDVPAGTYVLTIVGLGEDLAAFGDLDITDDLIILGAGMATTIIDGSAHDRVFHTVGGAALTLDAVTIRNGSGGGGSGIYATGDLTVTNSSVSDNATSGYGGGISSASAGYTTTITNCTLSNNHSDASGGAIYGTVNAVVHIAGATLSGNTAGSYGAAVYGNNGSTITIAGSVLDGNTSYDPWGAGAAVTVGDGSIVALTDSAITNSGTTNATGGVMVWTNSTLVITRSTITDNKGSGVGCGWDSARACAGLAVTNSAIEGNTKGSEGGAGIYTTGPTTVNGSSISNNAVTAPGGVNAGGIMATADLTVVNSTISGNSFNWYGGGSAIYFSGATATLTNTTVAGNATTYGGSSVRLNNLAATMTITNSILASVTSSCEANGATIISGGHNIDSGNTCGFAAAGDLVNTDPLLDVLADNGGLTRTRALQAGSPAIDVGDDAVCAAEPVNGLDQRGVERSQGTHCDIGAYEYP